MKKVCARLIAILLVTVMLAALSACSEGGGTSSADSSTSSSKAASEQADPSSGESASEAESTAPTGSGDTINFWYMGDSANQLQPIIDTYEAQTGNKIEVQAVPWNALTEKLLTAIASRSGPDCMQTAVSRTAELVASDAILDITSEIESTAEFSRDLYFEVAYDSLKMGDSYYGVPWISDIYPLAYRTDLFADAGYTAFPETWDELYEACVKIHENTGNSTFNVIEGPYNYNFLMSFPFQAGCDVVTEDGVAQFDTPEMKAAMEYIMKYIDSGISSDINDGVDGAVKLSNGDAAVTGGSTWLVSTIKDLPDAEGKWDMALWPEGPGGRDSVYAGSNLVITTWTDKKDACLEWIEHLVTKENILKHYETSSSLPPRIDAWDTVIAESEIGNMQVFMDQLNYARPFPKVAEMQEIGIEFTKYAERIMVGKEDIDTVLGEMQQRAEEILARSR